MKYVHLTWGRRELHTVFRRKLQEMKQLENPGNRQKDNIEKGFLNKLGISDGFQSTC
jgi:hypothetical protein